MQKAFEKYQSFIHEKDPKYLSEMQQLLSPYDIKTSFEWRSESSQGPLKGALYKLPPPQTLDLPLPY